MPRPTEAFEARILKYFQTAPFAAATLLFALVATEVKGRKPRGPARHRAEPPVNHAAPLAPPFKALAVKKKRAKRAKKKATAPTPVEQAHVEGE